MISGIAKGISIKLRQIDTYWKGASFFLWVGFKKKQKQQQYFQYSFDIRVNFAGVYAMLSWTTKIAEIKSLWKTLPRCINSTPNKPWFLHVCSRSLLKTQWKKKTLLMMSNFFFSLSVFYPFRELSAIFIKFRIVVFKLFQFRKGLTLYQWTNYWLFQTERVCRRRFHVCWKFQKALQTSRKHWGKKRNYLLRAISRFHTMF